METVGSLFDARRAQRDGLLLGSGGYRHVYLSGRVVYKYMHNWEDGNINREEYDNVKYIHSTVTDWPAHIWVPHVSLYDDAILAMPFIEGQEKGECTCDPPSYTDPDHDDDHISNELWNEIYLLTDIGDLGWGNIILRNGVYVVVDCSH